jgi:YVTN family beta-propeller protein
MLHRFPLGFALIIAVLARNGAARPYCPECENGKAFRAEMLSAMSEMDKAMAGAPMTGDPDHDFLAMMMPHHQGAIEMAKAVLAHGKDPLARRLAEEIVATQQAEIVLMERRLKQLPEPPPMTGTFEAPLGDATVNDSLSTAAEPTNMIPSAPLSHDRVYTADQTSNTVSVIDPGSNTLLGVIRLGDPVPGALSPLYRGQLLVHGLGLSPDHRTLAAISIASNSVTLIDTATNVVKGVVYVGRSPHEGFFTPDGRELWVAVRGESYVSVIDPGKMVETRRVHTANGPGMVLFRPDGRYAFIPSSFTPALDVVDTQSYEVVARVPQASPFSPNLAVSRDGTEVWFTLKDSGKTQVMSASEPFRILTTLDTGPITNHVALVDTNDGKLAYVTVGGENAVKVFRRAERPEAVATIATGDLPHGIWASGDGSRVYVGLENQDAVVAIDTHTNKIVATVPVGQQPQALIYVPEAVPEGDGIANLVPLGEAGKADHLRLQGPSENPQSHAMATVSVNSLGALDLLQIAATGLKPGSSYSLWLATTRTPPFGEKQLLSTFKANASGAQITQAVAPLRRILTSAEPANGSERRFLVVTDADTGSAQLIQAEPGTP